jgi:hypothetical protein
MHIYIITTRFVKDPVKDLLTQKGVSFYIKNEHDDFNRRFVLDEPTAEDILTLAAHFDMRVIATTQQTYQIYLY